MPGHTSAVTVLGLNYPPEPTGISPYTGAMSRGLVARGYRLSVVSAHPHYPEWRVKPGYGQWSRNEHLDGVSLRRLRHYVPRRPSGARRLLSEVSFGARAVATGWSNPDAIVVVSPALFSSAAAAMRAKALHRSVPLVVWVQDLYSLGMAETGQGGGVASAVVSSTERWLLRGADAVVVIHDRFKDRVVKDFGLDPSRVHVIRNWTHLANEEVADRRETRARMGWGDETVVLHTGNMGVKQGLENVVQAASLADDADADVRFVLVGNGGERDRLIAMAEGVRAIQFIEPLPSAEFSAAMTAADILLVNEKAGVAEMAVPSKLTSYFSAGRPVLAATDPTGITAEEVETAEAGVVVKAGEPELLLDAALALAADEATRARLGENGRRYRESVLSEDAAIDAFASLLSSLIDGDGRPAPLNTTE